MKDGFRKFSAIWYLFSAFAISTTFIVAGIGYFVISRDYQRLDTESLRLRQEYVENQKQQIKQEVDQAVAFIQYNATKAEERLRSNLKGRTNEAFAIATHLHQVYRETTGEREIRNRIIEALRPIRFAHGRGYFFITGLDGESILYADRPEMEMKSLLDIRDARGTFVVRDMIELVRREGEGFYRYRWTKPNERGIEFPKIAYVKYFAPLDAFIGTGEYLDDMEQDIREEVLERIGKIRFGKDGYIFVVSYDGVTLMNATQPELIGKNIWELTDPDGVKVIQEERKAAEKGGGDFIQYHWEKPSTKAVSPKISFVKGFPQWRWMVGAGVYADDIEPVIESREAEVRKEVWKDLSGLGISLVCILIAAQLICFRLSRYFKRQIDQFLLFFSEAETGGKPMVVEEIFSLEFRLMGTSANRMLEKRQKAEEDLRASEDRFHSLFSNMAEGVAIHEVLLDGKGKPADYRIVDINPQYEKILGMRRDQVVGRTATEVYGTREAPYLHEYSQVVLSGVPAQFETYFQPLDRHFEISIAPVGTLRFATIFTDVTARKRAEAERINLEAQLVQVRKLESIGQLAGGVAHDFNNMLAPILGYSQMLLDDSKEDPAARADLEQIVKAAERARDLTRQLLAFARKQTLQMAPLDLNRVVAGFERMLRRTIREDIAIETHLSPGLPLIEGDVGQIEQIILNLAVNAQDAMLDGGALVIETGEVILDETYTQTRRIVAPGPYVMVSVSDTGAGMDEETREKIFDPFFTTKELGRGTGLGLSTVYGIVKQHGGYIWVYSEIGKGTTFRIYFPGTVKQRETEVRAAPPEVSRGTETILVVEDQEQVRTMVCQMLRRYGYHVFEAADGKAALEVAASLGVEIDLLLTDVVMAGMNGKELYERLSGLHRKAGVLYMSGYTTNVISHHGVLDSSVHFIQKPFSINDLIRKVQQVLNEE